MVDTKDDRKWMHLVGPDSRCYGVDWLYENAKKFTAAMNRGSIQLPDRAFDDSPGRVKDRLRRLLLG